MNEDEDVTVEEDNPQQDSVPILGSGSYFNHDIQSFVTTYGWLLLLGACILVVLWQRYDSSKRKQSKRQTEELSSEQAFRRQEAMEAARQKMQENLTRQAEARAEIEKEKEREKAQARLEDWDRHQKGLGYRSKIKTDDASDSSSSNAPKPKPDPKKRLRNDDYNPLIGASSGTSFRPSRVNMNQGG